MSKSVTFTVENVWTKIDCDQFLFDTLDDQFAYFVDGYKHMQAYKMKQWDGKRHLLAKWKKFPTGLLSEAVETAKRRGYTTIMNDTRQRPDHDTKPWNLRGADEREHQIEAIVTAIETGRGIIYHATGAGKTEVMAAVIQMLDLPAIVMVNQATIATQTRERLSKRLGIKVGLLTGTKKQDGKVVVATFQTLHSQMKNDKDNQTNHLRKYLSKFAVVCIDEAHHTLASTYQAVVNMCPAYYRFGFSATPFKTEDKAARLHLVGSTGPVLDRFTPGEGVKSNLLVPAHITFLKWHQDKPKDYWKQDDFEINDRLYTYTGKKTQLVERPPGSGKMVRVPLPEKDWEPGLYDIGVAKHSVRNSFVVDSAITMVDEGLTTLILVERIDHGLWLKKNIQREIGREVGFVRGEDSQQVREAAKRKLDSGEWPVLIATTIFDEGVDVPSINGLIFAQGGKAQHRVIQRLGRGMRPKPGKDCLEVVDFYDTHSRTLWRHAEERMKAYKSDADGYKVEIVSIE